MRVLFALLLAGVLVTTSHAFDDPQGPSAEVGKAKVDEPSNPTDPRILEDPKSDPVDAKDPSTDPKNPKTDPKDPKTDPEDPKIDPKDPKTDPKDPTTNPKDPGTDPKEPKEPNTEPKDPKPPELSPEVQALVELVVQGQQLSPDRAADARTRVDDLALDLAVTSPADLEALAKVAENPILQTPVGDDNARLAMVARTARTRAAAADLSKPESVVDAIDDLLFGGLALSEGDFLKIAPQFDAVLAELRKSDETKGERYTRTLDVALGLFRKKVEILQKKRQLPASISSIPLTIVNEDDRAPLSVFVKFQTSAEEQRLTVVPGSSRQFRFTSAVIYFGDDGDRTRFITAEPGIVRFHIERTPTRTFWVAELSAPEDPTVDPMPMDPKPKDPMTDPKLPATDPKNPATDPKVPTTDPKVPTIDPKDPTTDPKDPKTDPTDSKSPKAPRPGNAEESSLQRSNGLSPVSVEDAPAPTPPSDAGRTFVFLQDALNEKYVSPPPLHRDPTEWERAVGRVGEGYVVTPDYGGSADEALKRSAKVLNGMSYLSSCAQDSLESFLSVDEAYRGKEVAKGLVELELSRDFTRYYAERIAGVFDQRVDALLPGVEEKPRLALSASIQKERDRISRARRKLGTLDDVIGQYRTTLESLEDAKVAGVDLTAVDNALREVILDNGRLRSQVSRLTEENQLLARFALNMGDKVIEIDRARTQSYSAWQRCSNHLHGDYFAAKYRYRPAGTDVDHQSSVLFFPESPNFVYFYSNRDCLYWGRFDLTANRHETPFSWAVFSKIKHLHQPGERPRIDFDTPTTMPNVVYSLDPSQFMLWPTRVGLPTSGGSAGGAVLPFVPLDNSAAPAPAPAPAPPAPLPDV